MPVSKLMTWVPKLDLAGTSLDDLIAALQALLEQEGEPDSELDVVPYNVTIDDKIAQIDELLCSRPVLAFDDLVEDGTSRIEVIVTLMALLELIRYLRVSVRQDRLFGDITIVPLQEGAGPLAEEAAG
jgi:chromatin segregation and condensation protein Rec8/ScpA/Scc1 (kleisin family)